MKTLEIILHEELDHDLQFASALVQLVEKLYPDGANADEISRVLSWATDRFGRSPFAPPAMFPPGMKMTVVHEEKKEFGGDED